jgi:hypothetical protein
LRHTLALLIGDCAWFVALVALKVSHPAGPIRELEPPIMELHHLARSLERSIDFTKARATS